MSGLFPSSDIGLFGRRLRHARGHRIPVSIVSNAAAAQDRDTVVLVDAFGADEAVLPEIGCRCCTVRVELQAALRRLSAERARRHFTRVVIETNHDLGTILRTFATEPALGTAFYVESAPPLTGSRFTLTDDTPLAWDLFSRFMATLTALRGGDLLHVKGMLNIEGCRGPVVVNCMGHLSLPPVELQAWPGEDRTSRVAFVTRGLAQQTITNLFSAIRSAALTDSQSAAEDGVEAQG